jgi:hypothetical protein
MFDLQQQRGLWDSFVERWRAWRGIDRWHLVEAEVLQNDEVQGDEVTYRELQLTYAPPPKISGTQPHVVIWLSKDAGSNDAYAQPGETVLLLVDPKRPHKAIFADTSQSAGNLSFGCLILLGLIGIFIIRGCKH